MTRSGATDNAESLRVMLRDRLAQFRNAERRRVIDAAARQRALRRLEHRRGRRKIGLPDFHVHDAAARRLERTGRGLHLHHVEGGDFGDACGKGEARLHRRA